MVSDTTDRRFNGDDIIYDDSNDMITASNDDYAYRKFIQKCLTQPLLNTNGVDHMKRYIKSAVKDKNFDPKKRKKEELSALVNKLRHIFELGVDKSDFAGCEVTFFNPDDSLYSYKFELSKTKYIYDSFRPTIIMSPTEFSPERVADALNRLHEKRELILDSEKNDMTSRYDEDADLMISTVENLMKKYDVVGKVNLIESEDDKLHSNRIFINFRLDSILNNPIKNEYLCYRNHQLFVPYIYRRGDTLAWNIGEYDKNVKMLEEAFEETMSDIQRWMDAVDYVEENLDSIYSDVVTQLEKFENLNQNKYPGLLITDIEVRDALTKYRCKDYDNAIKISFSMSAYENQIDLEVTFNSVDWNSMDVNKKLCGILNYRKRKYGIH